MKALESNLYTLPIKLMGLKSLEFFGSFLLGNESNASSIQTFLKETMLMKIVECLHNVMFHYFPTLLKKTIV